MSFTSKNNMREPFLNLNTHPKPSDSIFNLYLIFMLHSLWPKVLCYNLHLTLSFNHVFAFTFINSMAKALLSSSLAFVSKLLASSTVLHSNIMLRLHTLTYTKQTIQNHVRFSIHKNTNHATGTASKHNQNLPMLLCLAVLLSNLIYPKTVHLCHHKYATLLYLLPTCINQPTCVNQYRNNH